MLPRPQAAVVVCIDEDRAVGYGFRPDAPGLFIDVGTTAATMLLAAHATWSASSPVNGRRSQPDHRARSRRPAMRAQEVELAGQT
jgi:hypothetical protein